MRLSVRANRARLGSRVAILALLAGLASGCSSDVTRFEDGLITGSTDNQRQTIRQPAAQPYPGDTRQAGVDNTYTGSIARPTVRRSDLLAGPLHKDEYAGKISESQQLYEPVPPANVAANNFPAPAQPVYQPAQPTYQSASSQTILRQPAPPVSSAGTRVDTMSTGSIQPRTQTVQAAAPQQAAVASTKYDNGGWTSRGGTPVTVQPGETLYSLSQRHDVPLKALMTVNGLKKPEELRSGMTIIIPAFREFKTASTSTQTTAAADVANDKKDRVPAPTKAPEQVAVLPTRAPEPRQREQASIDTKTATSAASRTQAAVSDGSVYTVVAGDTLSSIARRTGTSSTALKEANGLSSGLIRIGQKLKIPAGGAAPVVVAKAETPKNVDPVVTGSAGPAKKSAPAAASATDTEMAKAVETAAAAPDATGIGRMRWPVRGRVITAFGGKNGAKANDGIDIAVPEGTAVKAAENGVVIYAGDGLKEFGNTVLVRHEDGLVTVYGHASKIEVARGDTVKRGQEIALSGMSGNADSPRLHFEVRKNSAPVDPAKFLE